jgi:hypothetical protein
VKESSINELHESQHIMENLYDIHVKIKQSSCLLNHQILPLKIENVESNK